MKAYQIGLSLFLSAFFLTQTASALEAGEIVVRKSEIQNLPSGSQVKSVSLQSVLQVSGTRTKLRGYNEDSEWFPNDQFLLLTQLRSPNTQDQRVKEQSLLKIGADRFFHVSYIVQISGREYLMGRSFSYDSNDFKEFQKIAHLQHLVSGLFEHAGISSSVKEYIEYQPQKTLVADEQPSCLKLQTRTICQRKTYGNVGVGYIFKNSSIAILCSKTTGCGQADLSKLSETEEIQLFNLGQTDLLKVLISEE